MEWAALTAGGGLDVDVGEATEITGGIIVGKGKPDFKGGTRIPPTKVEIIRPLKE